VTNVNPVLERTWQFANNTVITGETTQAGGTTDGTEYRKNLLLHLKNTLTGFALNPWTVAGSSSFALLAGAMDGVDRWSTIADLRWSSSLSGQRSWIVLQNSQLGIQLLFDCYNSANFDGAGAQAFVAPVGTPFTGGSVTARPTSAAEVQILSGTATTRGGWGSGDDTNTPRTYLVHIQHSADGKATRVVTIFNGVTIGFWLFDEIVDTPGLVLTHPWVARIEQSGTDDTDSITLATTYDGAHTAGRSNAGAKVDYYLAQPSSAWRNLSASELLTTPNPYDGRLTLSEVGLACQTAGWTGFFGRVADLWYAPTAGYTGRGYPASSNALVQFGVLVFPWDGSVPLVR